jgi:hypothetical protein
MDTHRVYQSGLLIQSSRLGLMPKKQRCKGVFMKKTLTVALLACLAVSAFAKGGGEIAKDLGIKQWEKVFGDPGKMADLKIDKLAGGDKDALKAYLIDHAADSDKPAAAGM